MTDSCLICECEAISLDDWFIKITNSHGKMVVLECICPWCIKEHLKR